MKKLIIIILAVLVVFLLFRKSSNVCFENKCINADVMDNQAERSLGLMFRESLKEGNGMLFIFDNSDRYSFWMKNVKFPIDIIFVNEDKQIVHIYKSVPPCSEEPCEHYTPALPAKYVVEVVAGFSDKYNVEIGQEVEISK